MNIILGKSKTGKSKYIFDEIKKDIKENKKVILFVPSQCRMITENNYMKENNVKGIIGVNITTINSYINDKIKETNLHIDEKYISKLDRKIIISKCLDKNKEKLSIFKKASNKAGFLDVADMYVDLCNKQGVEYAEKVDFQDKRLEAKFNDILLVYNAYKKEIEEKFIDSVKELDIFLNDILPNENFKDSSIYFDEYNNFTKKELEFLKELEKRANKVTISLDTDISCIEDVYLDNTNEIFEITNRTFKSLLKIANETGKAVETINLYENHLKANEDLKLIAANYFADSKKEINTGNLKIYAVKNTYDEIEKVAGIITEKLSEGYRYNDICIYTSNIKKYAQIVKNVMQKYNISVQIDDSFVIKNSKLCIYIKLLLEIINGGIKTENVIQILKLGLNDIPNNSVSILENYIKEFNISKYSLKKPLYMNNEKSSDVIYDLDSLNETREKIQEIFNFEMMSKTDITIKDIIDVIYGHMDQNNVLTNWNLFLQNEFEDNLYEIDKYNIESQVWDKICDIFDSMYKVFGDEKIDINEFYKVFLLLLRNVLVKSVPATLDQVVLADINSTRLEQKKICFFIGVNEDEFPKKEDEDILFKDRDLEILENSGIKLKETSLSRINMQMFNIYKAINNVSDSMYFSFPSSTLDGKSLRPSSVIKRLKEISNVKIIGEVANKDEKFDISKVYSKERAFYFAIKELENIEKNGIKDEEEYNKFEAIYSYITKDIDAKEILKYKKDDSNLNEETLKLLYSDSINTSISKLELFKKCPFSYYLKYILKINPRKEFEITSMDIGNFMHKVVEEFSKYLFENNIFYHEIIDLEDKIKKEYDEKLVSIINKTLEENFKQKKNSVKYEVLKLKLVNTMKKVIVVIAKSFNQSEFKPYGYEVEFSNKGEFRPIVIELENGKKINIIGKIDRIDTLKVEDKTYVRVVDYKSSSRDLDIRDIKEGISLQLITYIDALMENKKFLPAAMLYFNLSDKLVNLKDYLNDTDKIKAEVIKSLRMKGIFLQDINIIEKMDKKLSDGNERLIDISKNSVIKGSSKTLDEKEFITLCKEAKKILKELSKEILEGVVKINPDKKAEHCKYCDYYSVCRKKSCM